jgi:hypothetical protein
MPTPEAIVQYFEETLGQLIEVKAAKCDDKEWRTGVPAAMLEGRMDVLQEILDWMDNGEFS